MLIKLTECDIAEALAAYINKKTGGNLTEDDLEEICIDIKQDKRFVKGKGWIDRKEPVTTTMAFNLYGSGLGSVSTTVLVSPQGE